MIWNYSNAGRSVTVTTSDAPITTVHTCGCREESKQDIGGFKVTTTTELKLCPTHQAMVDERGAA